MGRPRSVRESRSNSRAAGHSAVGRWTSAGCSGCPSHLPCKKPSMDAIKGFLQGKWLGHPLHPALVHLPTALWPAALLSDLLSRTDLGRPIPVQISYYAIFIGLVVALVAALAGLADWADIKPEKPAKKIGLTHMLLNLVVVALFALNLWLRAQLPTSTDAVPLHLIGLTL